MGGGLWLICVGVEMSRVMQRALGGCAAPRQRSRGPDRCGDKFDQCCGDNLAEDGLSEGSRATRDKNKKRNLLKARLAFTI